MQVTSSEVLSPAVQFSASHWSAQPTWEYLLEREAVPEQPVYLLNLATQCSIAGYSGVALTCSLAVV